MTQGLPFPHFSTRASDAVPDGNFQMLRTTKNWITMSSASPRPPLVAVVGATGTGKSQVSHSRGVFIDTDLCSSLLYH